ncbi:MAG TPA: SMP-30/gluconolactonase/LRE family protein [Bacteroidales bacterium]|jgi:gluconolactonase|nr:SMP-30/gluconolactonase/LRE family protein [Bacteroidales bacterium]MDI9553641.1 SMP-30/gluconolactonase/LRE family protein [Bacteroidota bacterium]MBP7037885.1 SMP-30/gluconolactonase/LRE family protein [Bacteroidales bacterium]NLK53567.1 SMP-30/gluconolactonase/LRE family protein [Bacteroidales bacterium]HNY53802.1 SMP-30/gluconolactonase/LRE family protein [Bacteroidales bacterium]
MKIPSLMLLVMLLSFTPAVSQDDGLSEILKPGASLVKLAGEFSFTEGPAADKAGNVYFTDQPNDRIMKWSTKGVLSTFMQPSGRSNGMFFDSKDNLWSCADEKNEIWRIKPGEKPEVIALEYEGKLMNGPNDLWVSPEGNIFFTDPFYRRSWWKHSEMPQEKQCVYFLSADRKVLKRVEEELLQPNGIVGTPDGKTLYVADIKANKTWSYTINPDGSLSDKKLFCELGSDGMTIDSKGNIYLTGKGVTVFDKTGKKLGNIAVPENWSANVCFGGKDRKTLFITASKGLYSISTRYKGAY